METSTTTATKRPIDALWDEVTPADVPKQNKKTRKPRLDLRPGGKGMNFVCDPPEMIGAALEAVTKIHPKIIKAVATPGVPAGLTVYVSDRLGVTSDALCGTCGDKSWRLEVAKKSPNLGESASNFPLTAGIVSNQSPAVPADVLKELKLTPDESELMPIINWLYGFYGLTSSAGEFFLLLSVNALHELGFILDSDKEKRTKPILDALAAIDPENIRRYDGATPRLLGLDTLPDVPGSVIYNPLRYTPAGNTVIALKSGHILKALINYTSPRARAMSGLLARCFDYFLQKKAAAHALEVGLETVKNTVVKPAEKGLVDYIGRRAIEFEKELLKSQNELGQSRLETKLEKLERIRADKRAAEATMRAAKEAEKRVETEMALEDEREKHFVTQRGERLAILDKQTVEGKFEHHKLINRPTQTLTHSGDNQPRVGCVVLKATAATTQDASTLLSMGQRAVADIKGWDEGTLKLEDINSESTLLVTAHISDKTSFKDRRTTLAHCYGSAKNRACASNYTETRGAVLTLLGGHNVITYRTVFREEMITFDAGNKRNHTLFAVPAGKLASVVSTLKERCEGGFAAGVYDGRVLFVNETIMATLPEDDATACKNILQKLTAK